MKRSRSFTSAFVVAFALWNPGRSTPALAAAEPASPGSVEAPAPSTPLEESIRRGVDFLLETQRTNGSWGSGVTRRPVEILAQVPGSHRAFRVATAALCLMALDRSPHRRDASLGAVRAALMYLLEHQHVRRPNGVELYNVWSFAYVLQALSQVLEGEEVIESEAQRERAREAAATCIGRLERYQTLDGGWGYYDFNAHTFRPSGSGTSFTTATVLVALHAAEEVGLAVPRPMIEKALRALRRLRKADGSYVYGTYAQYRPAIGFNRVRGSLGRTPTCDYALWLYGENVSRHELRRGVENLFRYHHFIDIGRKRPIPHEAWYSTSGYYFYYGHYYSARVIDLLESPGRSKLRTALRRILIERQETDGSWWDYPLFGFHKPYGTALALLALLR